METNLKSEQVLRLVFAFVQNHAVSVSSGIALAISAPLAITSTAHAVNYSATAAGPQLPAAVISAVRSCGAAVEADLS